MKRATCTFATTLFLSFLSSVPLYGAAVTVSSKMFGKGFLRGVQAIRKKFPEGYDDETASLASVEICKECTEGGEPDVGAEKPSKKAADECFVRSGRNTSGERCVHCVLAQHSIELLAGGEKNAAVLDHLDEYRAIETSLFAQVKAAFPRDEYGCDSSCGDDPFLVACAKKDAREKVYECNISYESALTWIIAGGSVIVTRPGSRDADESGDYACDITLVSGDRDDEYTFLVERESKILFPRVDNDVRYFKAVTPKAFMVQDVMQQCRLWLCNGKILYLELVLLRRAGMVRCNKLLHGGAEPPPEYCHLFTFTGKGKKFLPGGEMRW